MPSTQNALFDSAASAAPAAPAHRRTLQVGEFRPVKVRRDCEDCWDDQYRAQDTGLPMPRRQRATYVTAGPRYVCSHHKHQREEGSR